jgi:hypothetical protein
MPPFLINSMVDRLLKHEFDTHRAEQTPHPIMTANGLEAVPFQHPQMDEWRANFGGLRYVDPRTNLLITGALDDVWQTRDKTLIVVDYKATAKDGQVTLDAAWQDGYKRQMGVYIWLLRKQGFDVNDRGFFLYCNGQDAKSFDQRVNFSVSLIPYTGNCDWIEPTLIDLKACLLADSVPPPPSDCEFCGYVAANQNMPVPVRKKKYQAPEAETHPADELRDVRDRVSALKERDDHLRKVLIAANEADRIGINWRANVAPQCRSQLDRKAVEKHFGAEAVKPFTHDQISTVVTLKAVPA